MSNAMRLVSFFVLSLALHAAALVYPVTFGAQGEIELVHVTILPIEQESLGGSGKKPALQASAKSVSRTRPAVQREVESKLTRDPGPQMTAAEATAINDNGLVLGTATANSAENHISATLGSTSNGVHGTGLVGTRTGGGAPPGGAGTASGRGDGNGSSENGIVLTQARYQDTPRPQYPDSARRDGREGRVLLRVLVDDRGRTKAVEINSSSGSDVLDRAAAEAIKRWRFYPARYGDQSIESWLRIPIEFRLSETKSW